MPLVIYNITMSVNSHVYEKRTSTHNVCFEKQENVIIKNYANIMLAQQGLIEFTLSSSVSSYKMSEFKNFFIKQT